MADERKPVSPGAGKRGFGGMPPEKQLAIARKGGASVPPHKRSFSQDRDLAADAGRKGGQAGKKLQTPASGNVPQQRSLLDGLHPPREF